MKNGFFILYLTLVVVQLIITNYLNLSAYVMISILPIIILRIPYRIGTKCAMLIAFITGLIIDMLSEGVAGLNVIALVPVALCRNFITSLLFGDEIIERDEEFTTKKFGFGKVFFAISIAQSIFFIIYLLCDGAFVRPFIFTLERFLLSLIVSTLLSVAIVDITTIDDDRR